MKKTTFLLTIFIICSCSSRPELVELEPEVIEEPEVVVEYEFDQGPAGFTMDDLSNLMPVHSGFRYRVPDGMIENFAEAQKFDFETLIIDRNASPRTSEKMIAIRKAEKSIFTNLDTFVEQDQDRLRERVRVFYDGIWRPEGLINRNINFKSLQFYYTQNSEQFFQRSVYIEYRDLVYVISLSSKNPEAVTNEKINNFWASIEID